jgi:hypothetical protein
MGGNHAQTPVKQGVEDAVTEKLLTKEDCFAKLLDEKNGKRH